MFLGLWPLLHFQTRVVQLEKTHNNHLVHQPFQVFTVPQIQSEVAAVTKESGDHLIITDAQCLVPPPIMVIKSLPLILVLCLVV